MTHRRLFVRAWTLVGLMVGVLSLTATGLALVQAQGSAAFITIVKGPDQTVVRGSTVEFTIAVTNTGDVTLTNVTVSDAQAPGCARVIGELASGQGTSYACTRANVMADFTNSAMATGTPPVGDDVVDTDTASVDVINPGIEIAKTPDMQTVTPGSTVTFTIAVTNTGDVNLSGVTVSDALAPNCVRVIGGLAPGGGTSYVCTRTDVMADFVNSATVTGTPPVGDDVTDTDTASVDVINPGIEIAKTPDMQTVTPGSTVTFTIAVTNTGDANLSVVTVSDASAPGCQRVFATLPSRANRRYSCTIANVTDGFINSATVTARPLVGPDVSDSDAAVVRLDDTLTCPSNMIAYWRLGETSGTTYDDFYNGHDGRCAGRCPTPAAGHYDGGQEFDGHNTGIDVPVVPGDNSFDWGVHDSFSIEFWMKADRVHSCAADNEVIVGRDDASGRLHWWVGINCRSGGRVGFTLVDNNGTTGRLVGTTVLTDGAWYHIVAVRDADAHVNRVYVNGTLEASQSVSYAAGFESLTAALNMGWLNLSPYYHFDGIADEVAVYHRALSSDEIRQHYNEGFVGRWYCQPGTFAPIIVSTPATEAISGRLYIYHVEAVGNPAPTYTLVTRPTGMAIDSATGLISWIPTVAQEGSHGVAVQASNSEGAKTQSFTITVYEGTICPANMVAYWKLNETGVITYEDFYDGHSGTCAGQCPEPVAGYVNGGQEFDGHNTGIDVPVVLGDNSFDWGVHDSFSIEFWMRADRVHSCAADNEVIVGRNDVSGGLHWWVGINCRSGGRVGFTLVDNNGTTGRLVGTTVLTDGAWYHIVAVRDADAHVNRVYVNGTLEASQSVSYAAGFESLTAALNMGWLNLSPYYHFDGIADEVAVYHRALSSDEIQQHYNEGEAAPGYCINPDISIDKVVYPMAVYPGSQVTYTYTVTNPGDAPLSVRGPSDDKCDPVTFVGGDDGDGRLEPGEAWAYRCSMSLGVDITNVAIVEGTHPLSGIITDTDAVFADVISPAVAIEKVADPMQTSAGDAVTYTYTVTNPGDDPLRDVSISDDKCSPVDFVGGDSDSDDALDLGEVWTYVCATALCVNTTNTAIVTATDSAGGPVSAMDTAFVEVSARYVYLPTVLKH